MQSAEHILTYYFTHAAALSAEKRFHLANRIAAWNGDPRAKNLLQECRSFYVPDPPNDDTLLASFAEAGHAAAQSAPSMVAYELRASSFARYPEIIEIEAELFRLRHLRALFGIDAKAPFLQRHSVDNLGNLRESLLADAAALRMLSSWAVNFLYLLQREILGASGAEAGAPAGPAEEAGADPAALYDLGDGYNTGEPDQLRLLIYLYTHCIIAASDFYALSLPEHDTPLYRRMLARLEKLLAAQPNDTSLDTKLEFLVCCRLASYTTTLEATIRQECAESLSAEGAFLVDTRNRFAADETRKTFEASEHRNVLFAMSMLPRIE